ncbi:hypothetical protein SDRG_02212 [Saprolegnia diclina VS20]|uniref:F-box domain-containing protein n=1 Tax=Saprolegnia diclina (strain VS20) TaxID=1156394 RepID=T0R1T9_SAPDV|nr:hypothetical protein SDRG_02212 [Saprolegnia diclina VS20]EQC40310.1 hypothetical protein SDRG_02212 [Saprolegnia diclina VS20]|eukprot:XP_008606009.1 hypothetical protein SDRG_02212 [Saprolegnia diclina VS20]
MTMMEAKRAKTNAGRWLLPPVILQVIHYLDEASDALAILQAVPSDARDEALDALVTLLTQDEFLWPTAEVDVLIKMDEATVITALPAFGHLKVNEKAGAVDFCCRTPCPPMPNVRAAVDCVQDLQLKFGPWVPSIVHLDINVKRTPLESHALERELAACPKLEGLNVQWDDVVDQTQLDDVMAAVAASCPRLAYLRLFSKTDANLQCCKRLLPWLSQPNARIFKLFGIDFASPAAKTLAHALLLTTTLETIKLDDASNVILSFLAPSSPPLPRQLRKLAFKFGSTSVDIPTLAAKLSPTVIRSLDVRFDETRDISPIMTTLPRTMRKLHLETVTMTVFPTLPKLQKLDFS